MRLDHDLDIGSLLGDPLIGMVMQSDGISEQAHADLWARVRQWTMPRVPAPFPRPVLVHGS